MCFHLSEARCPQKVDNLAPYDPGYHGIGVINALAPRKSERELEGLGYFVRLVGRRPGATASWGLT